MYKNYQSFNCKTIITKRTGKYKAKVRKMNIIYQGSKTKLRKVFVRKKKNKQEFLKKNTRKQCHIHDKNVILLFNCMKKLEFTKCHCEN